MATIANSVMLIGIVGSIDIDREKGLVTFTLTIKDSIMQSDGSFEIESYVFDCITNEQLGNKMMKANLVGRKIACEGRLVSIKDPNKQKSDEKRVFVKVEEFFEIER